MQDAHAKLNVTGPKDTDSPFLRGLFAPLSTEYTADTESMTMIGEIPKDLAAGPITRIIPPERIPNGAPACWVVGDWL